MPVSGSLVLINRICLYNFHKEVKFLIMADTIYIQCVLSQRDIVSTHTAVEG